ncbi:hypothetical protein [Flavimaricola marinus]|uniref:Holin-X, holin superfamily III n=1 Tax=Flavimaricola marinus TaxID=1819565 RepID=A0A238LI89_9RHOB|nr:hypothetical protein [Flavimaricola marinus]SMY09115.1 hypothetical protein LOM8899_03277 [Flavimaricola marinus]
MNRLLHDLTQALEDGARVALRDVLARLMLATLGVLMVIAGVGFCIAAGFIALSDALGPIWASVLLGAGSLIVGALLLAFANRRAGSREPVAPPPPKEAEQHPVDPATLAVFTAAFVAGRYVAGKKRE